MTAAPRIVVCLGIALAWRVLLRGRQTCRGTTLTTAQTWSFLAAVAWTSTWLADRCLNLVSAPLADHMWYACAVLALCPSIAVLGSRRPGTRVWNGFILVPMLLTLSWPIAALWVQGSELRGLQLETPQLIAICLVLVMGAGNYCGTTYTPSALLYAGAILALAFSCSAHPPGWLSDRPTTRFTCMVVMILSILQTTTFGRSTPPTKFDRMWFDFFDLFGIVWGRRIQDRVNFIAENERLPVRLELHGFIWKPAASSIQGQVSTDDQMSSNSSAVEARIDHILRWLLRRFVDPEWVDERLGSNRDSDVHQSSVDS